jgi:hypothetical protein
VLTARLLSCKCLPNDIEYELRKKKAKPNQKHISVVDDVTGPQLKNPSNCLPKTQVSANTKVDV